MDNTTTLPGGYHPPTPPDLVIGEFVFLLIKKVSREQIKKIKNIYGSFLDTNTWVLQALQVSGYENHRHECEIATMNIDDQNVYVLNTRFMGEIKEIKPIPQDSLAEQEYVVKLEYRGQEKFLLPGETIEMKTTLHHSKIVPISKISIITFEEVANLV